MLDLETLGFNFIVQIGACYFDIEGNIKEKLLINISIADSYQKGCQVDVYELKFWLENANKITWFNNTIELNKALQLFTEFCNKNKKAKVFSHYYDVSVLENVCRLLKRKMPFNHRNWRDIRTIVDLSGIKKEKKLLSKCCNAEVIVQGEVTMYYLCTKCMKPCDVTTSDLKTHNALEDCIYQVNYLVKAFKSLKNKGGIR